MSAFAGRGHEFGQPARIDHVIRVAEGQEVTARGRRARVPSTVQARQVTGVRDSERRQAVGPVARDLHGLVGRAVVGQYDLPPAPVGLGGECCQLFPEVPLAVPNGDDDADEAWL